MFVGEASNLFIMPCPWFLKASLVWDKSWLYYVAKAGVVVTLPRNIPAEKGPSISAYVNTDETLFDSSYAQLNWTMGVYVVQLALQTMSLVKPCI
jgi:hypothetical protein